MAQFIDLERNYRKLSQSFKYAWRGIIYTTRKEMHMRFHLSSSILALLLGYTLRISLIEYLILLVSIFLVLIAEMVNTSLEISVDLVTREKKPRAMLAKDVGAGAVLLASMNAIIIGYFLFFDRLMLFFNTLFR